MKSSILNFLYLVGLFFFCGANLLCNVAFVSNYLVQFRLFGYISFLILGILILCRKNKIRLDFILILILLCGLCFITYIKTGETLLLDLFFVLFASYGMDFRQIIKDDLAIKLLLTTIILVAHFLGYADSEFVVTRDQLYTREAFGFYHPNTFGMYIMMIYFEIAYLLWSKSKTSVYALGIATIIGIYATSNTRTAYITILLFLLMLICYSFYETRITKKNNSLIIRSFIAEWSFPALTGISYLLTIFYAKRSKFAIELNRFLSNRLYLQSANLNKYPIRLFGDNIEIIGTLDNGFLKLLLNFGFVSMAFFSIIFRTMIKKSLESKDFILFIILIALLSSALSESYILYTYYNIFFAYAVCEVGVLRSKEKI